MNLKRVKRGAKNIYLMLKSRQYSEQQKGAKIVRKIAKKAKKGNKGARAILLFTKAYFRDGAIHHGTP